MKAVRVINDFRDINDFALVHRQGEVVEVADERADELVSLGLAEYANGSEEQDDKPEKKTTKRTKK